MQIQYKAPRNWLQTLLQTEIAQGMALTLRRMFNRPITRQYPEEKPVVAAGFRGRHALVRDAETGDSRCVACMRCARVCPSHCIRIRWSRAQDNSRVVDAYTIDALRCIFCGYCAEVCPVNAIVLTEVYAYAANGRAAFKFDKQALLDNWDEFAAQKGDMAGYVNPLCRPRNMPEGMLAHAKRVPVDSEWNGTEQWVGANCRAAQAKAEAQQDMAKPPVSGQARAES